MLNLLVISDSPKALFIKRALQSALKVIIDVVIDFDHGLKDVFEKRPSIVCIQDEIDGVTGESVARHIQMLLGSSAPTFILLHTGNSSMKEIVGVYEHLVDLNQPDDTLAEEINSTLKALLGEQWGKIFIPPDAKPKPDGMTGAGAQKTPEAGETVPDDVLFDLEAEELLCANDGSPESASPPTATPAADMRTPAPFRAQQNAANGAEANEPAHTTSARDMMAELFREDAERAARNAPSMGNPQVQSSPVAPTAVPPSPAADFIISRSSTDPFDGPDSHELLLSHEKNYRSRSLLLRSVVVAVLVYGVGAVGWYLVAHNPLQLHALKQRFDSGYGAKPAPVSPSSPQQTPPPPATPRQAAAPSLPSFIPKNGHDKAYAADHPGWERYVGKDAEFRIFSDTGRVCAVQVLAKDAFLPEPLIKSVALECAGSDSYQIHSRTQSAGVQIENGSFENAAEIKIYRKRGMVKAFVVSLK
jgi:hypothetical protein